MESRRGDDTPARVLPQLNVDCFKGSGFAFEILLESSPKGDEDVDGAQGRDGDVRPLRHVAHVRAVRRKTWPLTLCFPSYKYVVKEDMAMFGRYLLCVQEQRRRRPTLEGTYACHQHTREEVLRAPEVFAKLRAAEFRYYREMMRSPGAIVWGSSSLAEFREAPGGESALCLPDGLPVLMIPDCAVPEIFAVDDALASVLTGVFGGNVLSAEQAAPAAAQVRTGGRQSRGRGVRLPERDHQGDHPRGS